VSDEWVGEQAIQDANKRVMSTNRRRIGNLRPSGSVVEDALYCITELVLVGWVSLLRGTTIYDSVGVLNGLLQALDSALEIEPRIEQGLMLHPPHWFEGVWVAGQTGNHMPVYMRELVAKEFVVDLLGLIDL
jgi:hypothetical protein